MRDTATAASNVFVGFYNWLDNLLTGFIFKSRRTVRTQSGKEINVTAVNPFLVLTFRPLSTNPNHNAHI